MNTDSLPAAAGGLGALKEGDAAITSVRVLYPDLHGIARGKDVPIQQFDDVVEHGLCFCAAVMGTDLRHTPVVGGEARAIPDLIARPDLATMRHAAVGAGRRELPRRPRARRGRSRRSPIRAGRSRRAVAGRRASSASSRCVGPELEFFLVVRDPAAPNGVRRHVDNLSMVYTVGPLADPGGLVRRMTEQLATIGLDVFAVNHEFMNSQYEINLRHSGALDAADRAFRLKAAVKDIAAQNGLHRDLHGQAVQRPGRLGHAPAPLAERATASTPSTPRPASTASSPELRHFTAGLIEHAPALMAFLNPTINAYRRIQPDSLAPTHANWGFDNRATFVRIPPERGGATRVELRVGDGAANPYLAIAAALLAGADGVRRKLEPPPPLSGDAYRADPERDRRTSCRPRSTRRSTRWRGTRCCATGSARRSSTTFLAMKGFEIERHRAWVSDWEITEYLHHL